MTELLNAAQMRAVEAAAMADGAVSGLDLMERAGRGVVDAIFAEWPALAARSGAAVVLCGPGSNGGDGFVVARLLKAWGWTVKVFELAAAEPAGGDAAAMRARWGAMGEARALGELTPEDVAGQPLVIDALFGTGLARPVGPEVWRPLALAQDSGCRIVAVDILSGICADSGRVRSESGYLYDPVQLTVTFETRKRGHVLDAGAEMSGALRVVPIGLRPWMAAAGADVVHETAAGPDLAKTGGHKYGHGHALVLAGGAGRGGAGRLAAHAALRIGAGLVTLGCPPVALQENAARLDAVMLRALKGAEGLTKELQDPRLNALCLGPGLGLGGAVGETTRETVEAALKAGRATVLDADALTVFANAPEELFALLHPNCVLTPHGGEFARLFPDLSDLLGAPQKTGPAYSKVDATIAGAARAGCVVLYKGPDTVIADASGRAAINVGTGARAAPWLATAGTGDVLSGFVTGLMARGFDPFEAATAAAWLQVECALGFGPGLISEDLARELPKVFRALGL